MTVVGSANQDYTCSVARLPAPGETVLGGDVVAGSGGKGGNQAVAAARVGASTALVACVGDDPEGQQILTRLSMAGVDTTNVKVLPQIRTGVAFVFVTCDGDNSIVVSPGANAKLTGEETAQALRVRLTPTSVLVASAEIPAAAVAAALTTAEKVGSRVVLNLAPYRPMDDDLLASCDPLVLNAGEAGALLDHPVDSLETARQASAELGSRVRSVVITLGGLGAVVSDRSGVVHVAAPVVDVVDSTGAGDAFTGVLAASLSQGQELVAAVRLGVAAGSLAVTRRGAQPSYPNRTEVATVAQASDLP